jgi:glycosyltransferase involved in cell wall biosynthesis
VSRLRSFEICGDGFGLIFVVRLLVSPDVVVSPTNWLLGAHRQFGFFQTGESRMIPNPMQIDAVDVFSVDRDPRRLVFVGRLDTDKGADVLFDAWPKLRDVVSELVLIGDGAWRDRFEALRDPRIVSCEVFCQAQRCFRRL